MLEVQKDMDQVKKLKSNPAAMLGLGLALKKMKTKKEEKNKQKPALGGFMKFGISPKKFSEAIDEDGFEEIEEEG
jgi:hypothetical protein